MTIINTRESILASLAQQGIHTVDAMAAMLPKPSPHYTLDTFNAQQMAMYGRMAASRVAHPNNIACPRCSAELWDDLPLAALTVNPATIDLANPPHQSVSCHACGWAGMRLL